MGRLMEGPIRPKRMATPPEVRRVIEGIVEDLEFYIEEYELRGATFLVDGTWEGAVTLFIAIHLNKTHEVEALYIPHLKGSSIPAHLERWASQHDLVLKPINLREVVGLMRTYLSNVSPARRMRLSDIHYSLLTILARAYADNRSHILVGRYTYTQSVLGRFNVIEYKSVDYHPLMNILYSDLPRIAYVYRFEHVITKSRIDASLETLINELRLPNVEALDNLILTIKTLPGGTADDIAETLGIDKKAVEKVRDLLYFGENFKSMTPLSPQ